MNWRDETIPHEFNANEQLKTYVKNELTNFYLYLGKWQELEEKKKRIRNRSIGCGSVIQIPEGSKATDSVQHRTALEISALEHQQKPYIEKMEKICRWMDVLTLSQYKIVRVYMMRFQCKKARNVSEETSFAKDTIYQYADEAVDRIINKINKIL